MLRKDLIKKIADKTRISQKDTQLILNTLEEVIINNLKRGKEVKLNIGKFEVKTLAPTQRFNIGTKQVEQFAASKVVKFKVASNLKKIVKGE